MQLPQRSLHLFVATSERELGHDTDTDNVRLNSVRFVNSDLPRDEYD